MKDDGVHNYTFGQMPGMPWKVHLSIAENLRELADKIENKEYKIDVKRSNIGESIDYTQDYDNGLQKIVIHIELIKEYEK